MAKNLAISFIIAGISFNLLYKNSSTLNKINFYVVKKIHPSFGFLKLHFNICQICLEGEFGGKRAPYLIFAVNAWCLILNKAPIPNLFSWCPHFNCLLHCMWSKLWNLRIVVKVHEVFEFSLPKSNHRNEKKYNTNLFL